MTLGGEGYFMKNFAIGLSVVVALSILWAALQAIGPRCKSTSG